MSDRNLNGAAWAGCAPCAQHHLGRLEPSSRIATGGGQSCGHASQAVGRRLHRASRVAIPKGGGWRGCWQWHGISPEQEGGSGGRLCVTPSHVRAAQRAMLWTGAMCFGAWQEQGGRAGGPPEGAWRCEAMRSLGLRR
jgi:hypothetical protein